MGTQVTTESVFNQATYLPELSEILLRENLNLDLDDSLLSTWRTALEKKDSFQLKIGQFDPTQPALEQAAFDLNSTTLKTLLDKLGEDLSDGDYLTLWESIQTLHNTSAAASYCKHVTEVGPTAAVALVDELKRVPGAPEDLDWDYLLSGLNDCLAIWPKRAQQRSLQEARYDFLAQFLRRVMGTVEAPNNVWQVMLLKLEAALQMPNASSQTCFLEPVFRLLWDTLQLQPALIQYNSISEELPEEEQEIAANVAAIAFCAKGPTRPSIAVLEGLHVQSLEFTKLTGEFTQPNAFWRDLLSQRLERAFADTFTDAANQCERLHKQVRTLEQSMHALAESCEHIGTEIAQGMTGNESSKSLTHFCQDLLTRSVWAAALTKNALEARELFIPQTIRELGIDPRTTIWRKHSRMLAMLQKLCADQSSDLPWSRAAQLIGALESRISEMVNMPIRWLKPPPPLDESSSQLDTLKNTEEQLIVFSLERLVVEQRLHGRSAQAKMRLWTAEYVFGDTLPENIELFVESYQQKLANPVLRSVGESDIIDLERAVKASREYVSSIPRISAAVKLTKLARTIAEKVAREVVETLPEYGDTIGEAGYESCIRDNRLTLLQIADVLLANVESPAELITEWWSSVVGAYLANRPANLFETNLSSLYRAMSAHLGDVETDIAFGIIQEVYNETLSVSCIEALAGRPTPVIGPIGEAMEKDAIDLFEIDEDSFVCSVNNYVEGDSHQNSREIEKIASVFIKYSRDSWRKGESDIAASRIMPELARLTSIPDIDIVCAALTRACAESKIISEKTALLLEESVDDFIMLLAQSSVGIVLKDNVEQVAVAYSKAMVSFAPKHFKHLTQQDAVERCSRDQKLLYTKIAELLQKSSPNLFWIDASRYFLELLSPYVDYPSRVWALSFRTILKQLSSKFSLVQNLFMARCVSQFEYISSGWSKTHELASSIFDPRDYTFSARPEDERPQRDLLVAILVADNAPETSPWPGRQIINRFLLSWTAGDRSLKDITALTKNIERVVKDNLTANQLRLLQSVPALTAKLHKAADLEAAPLLRYATLSNLSRYKSQNKVYALLQDENKGFKFYQNVRQNHHASRLPATLALAAARSHLVHPLESEYQIALSSSFLKDVQIKLSLRALLSFAYEITSEHWAEWTAMNLDHAPTPRKFRSEMISLQLYWPAIEKALPVIYYQAELAKDLIKSLKSNNTYDYSQAEKECNDTTNSLAFGYAHLQTAFASIDPSVSSPRLFFGTAAENASLINPEVAANAHTRTATGIRNAMKGGGIPTSKAINEIAEDLFRITTPAWLAVAFTKTPKIDPVVSDFFIKMGDICKHATAYVSHSNPAHSKEVVQKVEILLRRLCRGLRESGDTEASFCFMMEAFYDYIETDETDDILTAIYGIAHNLEPHLGCATAVFWRYTLLESCRVMRQAKLGYFFQKYALEAAEAYAKEHIESQNTSSFQKCASELEYILESIGHCLSSQSPQLSWINVSSKLLNAFRHFEGDTSYPDVNKRWRWLEAWFGAKVPLSTRVAVWEWFGTIQEFSRLSKLLQPLSVETFPQLSHNLSIRYGGYEWQWLAWLNAIAAVSSSPINGFISPNGCLERLVLSTPFYNQLTSEDWESVTEYIINYLEEHAAERIPNVLKKSITRIPDIQKQIAESLEAGGSNVNRFIAANPSATISKPLFRAFSISRVIESEQTVRSDKADLIASKALGLEIESDDRLIKRLNAHKASLSIGQSLKLQAPEEKKNFLSKLGFGKKKPTFDWLNSDELREECTHVLDTLSMYGLLEQDLDTLSWYLATPTTFINQSLDEEAGLIAFYSALGKSLELELGQEHPTVQMLLKFQKKLTESCLALRLDPTSFHAEACFALCLLGFRETEDKQAYFTDLAPAEVIENLEESATAKNNDPSFSENELEILRKLATALKRGLS